MDNSEILASIQDSENKPAKSLNAWLLLGFSLLLFAGLGIFQWKLEYLILVTVAIFIHELGHLLAMKLFRYKNLKMLFLPFLGGVASGESKEQNASKIALISLFGPLVGFLSCYAALILWFFTRKQVLIDYAYLALYLNAFNLVPLMPLDGGHFLNETLFARFPKAELVFRIFAFLGLVYLAYDSLSWIFGLLAFFILITLQVNYQLSRVASQLRKEDDMKGGELTEEKVGRIRNAIVSVNPHFEKESNLKGLPGIIGTTWIKVNKTFPSLAATIGLLVAYVSVFIGLSLVTTLVIYLVTGDKPAST